MQHQSCPHQKTNKRFSKLFALQEDQHLTCPVMPSEESSKRKLANLGWAVKSRSENQVCAIRLFELLTTYRDRVRQRDYQQFAQHLVAVTFSLWRAAFLADKSGGKEDALNSAIEFLETVIADNAITYAQDKKQREWTFSYYINNVRFTLLALHSKWPELVPKWELANRPPKKRWEYGQQLLKEAVERFETALLVQP
jgi:hypothetical protein